MNAAEPEVVADCEGDLPVFADGARTEASVCAESESFTPVSLSDEWTPQLFDEDPSLGARGRQPYRETYLALANERFDEMNDPNSERRYLELYGIFPTPSLLAARLGDDERHACHDAIDDSALEGFDSTIRFRWDPEMRGRFARRHERREAHLERILESEDDLDEPADLAEHPEYDDFYERYVSSRNAYEALRTTQRHLECDGLLEEGHFEEGALDGPTMRALRAFQRKEMIVGRGHLDPETAAWIREFLRAYCERQGATILLASHDMREVELLCEDVVLLRQGKLVERGSPNELIERFGRKTLEDVFLDIARGKEKQA